MENPARSNLEAAHQRIAQLERDLKDKDALIETLENEIRKTERVPLTWNRAQKLLKKLPYALCLLALAGIGIYCSIWLFEWNEMRTFEGVITRVKKVHTTLTTSTTIVAKTKTEGNGLSENKTTENPTQYKITIQFIDGDGDKQTLTFDSLQDNDWDVLTSHTSKLPYFDNKTRLYMGKADPYPECRVKVYELRGAILNSNTSYDFIANVSMCREEKKTEKP